MSPRKAEFRDGRKVRPARRKVALGKMNRRIVLEKTRTRFTDEIDSNGDFVLAKYERSYHATKGWRQRRVPL